jgi:hypothetical protein
MATEDDSLEEEDLINPSPARAFTTFMVAVTVLVALSLFVLYSTMRSRCIGITTGYLKAIETAYQTGEYRFNDNYPNNNFETGIYKVYVNVIKSKSESGPIILRVEVKDRFFSVTHYSEELKLIPMLDPSQK